MSARRIACAVLIVGIAAAGSITGCGSGSGGGLAASRAYLGTQAPGDVWSWTIGTDTFTATNETTGYTYSGTVSTLPTGFMKLVIDNTTDPGITTGQAAYALEMPGTALLVKPAGADTEPPIVAASLGANPPGPSVKFNFVTIPSTTWNPANDEAFGYVDLTVTGNAYDGPTKRYAVDGTPLPDASAHLTGDAGRMTLLNPPGGGTATAAMTPSGVCAFDYGPGNGGVIGVKQPAQNVDTAVLASESYRGFLIDQGKTQCIACSPNGDGTLHGAGYANPSGVETGTSDNGSGVTVSFTSQPNPGEVTIHLTTTGGAESMAAAVNQIAGKYMLFGFGLGQDGKGYNFLLVEN